jgi:hypothetical protein
MTYAIKAIGDMDVHVDDHSKRQEISQKIVQETMKRGPIQYQLFKFFVSNM